MNRSRSKIRAPRIHPPSEEENKIKTTNQKDKERVENFYNRNPFYKFKLFNKYMEFDTPDK